MRHNVQLIYLRARRCVYEKGEHKYTQSAKNKRWRHIAERLPHGVYTYIESQFRYARVINHVVRELCNETRVYSGEGENRVKLRWRKFSNINDFIVYNRSALWKLNKKSTLCCARMVTRGVH